MKNFVFTLAAILLLIGCKNDTTIETLDTPVATILAGRVALSDPSRPQQLQVFAYNYLAADYEELTTAINNDGTFSIEFPLQQPIEVAAMAGAPFSFIAAPGDSIYVEITPVVEDTLQNRMTFSFSGDRATSNNKLQDYKKNFPIDVQAFYNDESDDAVEEFSAFAKANQSTLENYNKRFVESSKDPLLTNYIKAQEKYYLPTARIDYVNYRGYYGYSTPALDSNYYDFIPNIPDLQTQDLINPGVVQRLIYNLTYHYRSQASSLKENEGFKDTALEQKVVEQIGNQKHSNSLLYNYVIHYLYLEKLNNHDVELYESTAEELSRYIDNDQIRNSIIDKYSREKKLVETTQLPQGAALLEFESTQPEDYLQEVIDNAQGKVIYIDNWATWCAPCKAEFKNASPQLHDKFEDDVEFIYFCHNSEKRSYIPTIAEFKIKGKHYFLNEAESAAVSKMIDLEGFPTYTIINKKGEIVLSDYIHTPSYPETTALLTRLTNE